MRTDDVLRHDGLDPYRELVLRGVRERFGEEAVPFLKARMQEASREEILCWKRCLHVAPSLPQLLDCTLSSSAELVSPERLLQHAFDVKLNLTSVLLLYRRMNDVRADRLCILEGIPWVLDLPHPSLASFRLRRHGWLLIACHEASQAWLLFESIPEGGRLTARLLSPCASRLQDGELESEPLLLEPGPPRLTHPRACP